MIKKVNNNFALLQLFFYLVIIEVVIGGSGRMIEFGPLSLKMVFFGIAIAISFFSLKKIQDISILRIQFFLIASLSLGFGIAAFNNAKIENILEDIKPLLFVFMINYFVINIKSIRDVEIVTSIIKWSSLVMAIVYLLFVVGLYVGYINFDAFYKQQSEGSEVMFRNEYFFLYKGFLYLGIGFFFCILSGKKIDKIFAFILFTALCLTLTRGFILAASIIYLYYIFFINKSYFLKILTIILVIISILYLLPALFETLGNKSDSDMIRVTNINQVLDEVNYFSFFFGHGFGTGVPIRPVHMEVSFLEIFHKQGILGLLFWVYILVMIFSNYFKIKSPVLKNKALPYVLSVCFVYIQSFTNPFINNPIGISIVILSIVVINKLLFVEKNKVL